MQTRAKILAVDDRPQNLFALEALLAPLGHEVLCVASGPDALRALLQDEFAVILLDVRMPGMDGFECAEAIKARERTRRVPIIFLTAEGADDRFRSRAYDVGAVDYLAKPLEPEVLRAKAQAFVDLHLTTLALQERTRALRRSEALHRTMVRHLPDALVLLFDPDGVCQAAEGPALETLGWRIEDLVGSSVDALPPEDAQTLGRRIESALAGTTEVFEWPSPRDGRHFSVHIATVDDGAGAILGALLVARDTTAQKRAEAELAHRALHDTLTGLPTRGLLMNRIEHALARLARSGRPCAVLFVDLDNFKYVNDSMGHEVGDRLLVEAARRLEAGFRPSDTVARLGGDEFVVLCEGLRHPDDLTAILQRVMTSLAVPLDGMSETPATASVGVTVTDDPTVTAERLIADADAAMYAAKRSGGGRFEIFDKGMRTRASELLSVERDLRQAVSRNELRLLYQPKIDVATEAMVGVEALVRWHHPERGVMPPGDFIPIAEDTGLIVSVGEWVLGEACRQARRWADERPGAPPLAVAVNLSARQLAHGDLVATVASVLEETGVAPETLQLEITESAVMADLAASLRILTDLKALGVRLSLDDFGTGHSSLSYLKRFPLDVLEIDRSFVAGLGEDADDTAIVETIIGLAHSLRLVTVAEGVETDDQLEALRSLGCDLAQGFLFGRPEPREEIARRLRAGGPQRPRDLAVAT